jgi:hypothetical protein
MNPGFPPDDIALIQRPICGDPGSRDISRNLLQPVFLQPGSRNAIYPLSGLKEFPMRGRFIMAAFLVLAGIGAGGVAARADDLESTYVVPEHPDPTADNGTHFTASQATAGAAIPSTGAASAKAPASCSALNPCAATTPVMENVSLPADATLSRAATVHKTKG